ncbi:MAG: hypothetical protein ABI315_15170 [Bacteroidia bacterium]
MTSISFLVIWFGMMTIKENYFRNINKVERIDGQIESTEIIVTSKRAGAVPSATLKLKFLKIELKNSSIKLFTYNARQDYSELERNLERGTNVTVFYKKLKEEEVTNNIFRMDLGQQIILTDDNYKEKEYFAGTVMVLFGLFVLIFGGYTLKKKGLNKHW